ncbi:MAG: DUF362 domain-containing protein [Chitinophagales bacterium]|nr:DUF362 domain-containing protein [Chitinophagales bacterium]
MPESRVSIVTSREDEMLFLFDSILNTSGFWKNIEAKRKKLKKTKQHFRILIKPDIDFFVLNSSTCIQPALVEYLIDTLVEKGFVNCVIAGSDNSTDFYLENRDVNILADLVGYKYITPGNHPYDIINLSENLSPANFDSNCVLKNEMLSADWLEADFRIIVSKNKTDEEFYYSLCLNSLIDILPEKAKHFHYYFKYKPDEVALALYNRNEVDFCIIDAFESNHGSLGALHQNPIETKTFIAGNHVLLTDWAAALKMGLDPYASSMNSYALKNAGLPENYKLTGDLSIYPEWKNVSLTFSESVKARNINPVMRQLSQAWLQEIDTDIFPFKNIADSQVNKILSPIIKNIDEHPLAYSALIFLNYSLGNIQKFIQSWQILYDKEKVFRKDTDLGFDPAEFSSKNYQDVVNYIKPLAQIVEHIEPDANGLKWRYIDDSVLFEYTRTLPYNFSAFIAKVDIAQSVQFMFDNIGGARIPVKHNQKNKIIHQAERDLYLPQPNWMVFFGGKYIDVCKIECIEYASNKETMYWRTIKSLNNSADYDDGMVEISAAGKNITQIKIVARQKFTLPLFFQVINMDYLPKVKNALVSDAYNNFFSKTIANFEAAYEGRNVKGGKTIDENFIAHNEYNQPFVAEQFKNVIAVFSGIIEKWVNRNKKTTDELGADTDENGYRHFGGNTDKDAADILKEFASGVSDALKKDMKYLTGNN